MRLNKILSWWHDESGLVLAFSAILMPVILLLGVLIIQSGQLYVRQAELQFLSRQIANSALVPVAKQIQAQALVNRTTLCSVEPPLPSVCSSQNWQDFLNGEALKNLVESESVYQAVALEIETFAEAFDPQKKLQVESISFEFPLLTVSDRLSVKVELAEPQTWWLGRILAADNYHLEAQSLSYLKL